MNKIYQRITTMDSKRCEMAIAATQKLAVKVHGEYQSIVNISVRLVDALKRLKLFYTLSQGLTLHKGIVFPTNQKILRDLIGDVNRLYAYAYPANRAAELREVILKPLTLTLERLDWLEAQK